MAARLELRVGVEAATREEVEIVAARVLGEEKEGEKEKRREIEKIEKYLELEEGFSPRVPTHGAMQTFIHSFNSPNERLTRIFIRFTIKKDQNALK